MRSPFSTSAMGPPSAASGLMWPRQVPAVPPEKRPSVMSATCLPSPCPLIIAGGREHFRHARAAFRAFVADHHHVAGLHLAPLQRRQAFVLRVEDDRFAVEDETFRVDAGAFDHRAIRGQVAEEHRQPAIRGEGIVEADE